MPVSRRRCSWSSTPLPTTVEALLVTPERSHLSQLHAWLTGSCRYHAMRSSMP